MNWLIGLFSPIMRASMQRAAFTAAPLVIVLVAALLRFNGLGTQSLWNDEGNSLRLAQRPIPALITASRLDIHPPGYYLLLKWWLALMGETEFAMRALSALAGVLTVACVYALGKALYAPGAGVLAAALVAVNTSSLYYSQEARMYALLACWAAASMLAFVRWLKTPRWPSAITVALLNAAGLYTQYVFPFVMLTQGAMVVCLLLAQPTHRARWLRMFVLLNLLTLALFAPQLGDAWRQVTEWPRTGGAVDVGTGATALLQWLTLGNTAINVSWWVYALLIVAALAGLLPDWLSQPLPSWWRRLLPLVWLLVAILPFFALGLFREANLKFLLPAQVAAAVLIGRGMWLLWQLGSPNFFIFREAWPRLLALIVIFYPAVAANDAIAALCNDPRFARPDYRRMAQTIRDAERDGDAILLNAPNQQEVFTYYYAGRTPIFPIPRGLGGDDEATRRETAALIAQHRRLFVLYWGEAERDPNRVVEKTLSEQTFEVRSSWFGDVRFVQYATPPATFTALDLPPTRFGDAITLSSAAISTNTPQAGDVLAISLTWQTDAPLTKRYKVFLHLVRPDGRLAAQRDSEPANYLQPTTTWQPNTPVIDAHGLLIPPTLPAGDYALIVGWYDADDPAARLPVGDGDTLTLATISVRPN
jgi:4-amino-4-deoxy-L-arabinose transferase-like glycosyltransferase